MIKQFFVGTCYHTQASTLIAYENMTMPFKKKMQAHVSKRFTNSNETDERHMIQKAH